MKLGGIPNIESAGLGASQGAPADEIAQQISNCFGVDLGGHSSRNIQSFQITSADLLIAFEPSQAKALELEFKTKEIGAQVVLAGMFLSFPLPHIEDPYGLGAAYFAKCFQRIDQIVEKLSAKLRNRIGYRVLVADADSMGAIAVLRSLGRSGYRVHAMSQTEDGLGLKSSYVDSQSVCPKYSDPLFLNWFRNEVKEYKIQAIIPSESLLLALRPCFEEFAAMIPLNSADPKRIFSGMGKYDLFVETHPENCPPFLAIDFEKTPPSNEFAKTQWREALNRYPGPFYVKMDASHKVEDFPFAKKGSQVLKQNSVNEVLQTMDVISREYTKVVIQQEVSGRGVGVFFLVWNGVVRAHFMHLRLHEVPHTGGYSSLRREFYHAAIYEDAKKRVLNFGWQGPAMMEYRWDEQADQFYLMEMNGRFWGSLHLPIYAGVDFPKLLMQVFRDRDNGLTQPPPGLEEKVNPIICRNFIPGEVQYLISYLRDPLIGYGRKGSALIEFIFLTINPFIYSDLYSFPGDRRLAFIAFSYYIKIVYHRIVGRLRHDV
jgi:protein-tyrosine-phosphatase